MRATTPIPSNVSFAVATISRSANINPAKPPELAGRTSIPYEYLIPATPCAQSILVPDAASTQFTYD